MANYIGVDNKARIIKNGYIGVNGKARRILKAYIGVDNKARLCWTLNPETEGLYDSGNNLLASWDELVNKYGLTIGEQSSNSPNSLNNIINNYFPKAKKIVVGKEETEIAPNSFTFTPLTYIGILDNVVNILPSSFVVNLESFGVSQQNYRYASVQGVLYNKNISILVQYPSSKNTRNFVIPESVTSILSRFSFSNCKFLSSVFIPKNVEDIPQGIFSNCEKLKSIDVDKNNPWYNGGKSLSSKEGTMIRWCPATEETLFYNAATIKEIGSDAFDGCNNIEIVNLSWSIKSLGDGAFSNCKNLKSVVLGTGITDITTSVFSGCENLKSVIIHGKVTSIGGSAFRNCLSLTRITIPSSVTKIGNYAFYGCSSLTSITIPDSVIFIDDWAFAFCSNLKSIVIPNSVTTIGDAAFRDTRLKYVYYEGTEDEWELVQVGDNNANLTSKLYYVSEGIQYTLNADNTYSATGLSNNFTDTYIFMPSLHNNNKVTEIGAGAFSSRRNIKNVCIPSSVKNIGANAFEDCAGLEDVLLQEGLLSIGNLAFQNCANLTNITIPDSVTSIGENVFARTGLTSLTIPGTVKTVPRNILNNCKSLNSVVLSSGVTSIYVNAFSSSSIAQITIPNTVTNIATYAFYDCPNLSTVYYEGTEDEWNNITINEYGNEALLNATIVYNSNLNN